MNHRSSLALLALSLPLLSGAQQVTRSLSLRSNELTVAQLGAAFSDHARRIVGRRADASQMMLSPRLFYGVRMVRVWCPDLGLMMSVESRTGALFQYFNSFRAGEIHDHKNRTGKTAFATEAKWREHLLRMAKLCGMTGAVRLSKFGIVRGAPMRDEAVAALLVSDSGRLLGNIVCDPQDGALIDYIDRRFGPTPR